MAWRAACWAATLCLLPAVPAVARVRVASVSECGDTYVLMLADRDQIAAVSPQADGTLGVYPERAKGLPRTHGDLESLLAARADLVVLEEGAKPQLVQALQRLHVRTIILPDSADFPDVAKTVRAVAAAMGQSARGEAVVAVMTARIHALEAQRPPQSARPIALYFRPDGGGTGGGTFMNRLIELAGFRNMQLLLGQQGWRSIPLEAIVQNPPQVFITGFFDTQADSVAAVRGSKLAVAGAAQVPVIALPGRGMVCASPALITSAEQAAAQRRKLFGGGR